MIEIKRDKSEFRRRLPEVALIYQAAFSGPPWHEDLPIDEAEHRIQVHAGQDGFDALLAYDHAGTIVGSLWYEDMTPEGIVQTKGEAVAAFAAVVQQQHGIERVVFTHDTIVHPKYQGRKIASQLKDRYIDEIAQGSPNGAVILTRHRDDNLGIIRTSETQGFSRTGIRMPSSQNPDTHHEYWYKMFLTA